MDLLMGFDQLSTDVRMSRLAQQPVHHGTVFGGVDALAAKHGITVRDQPGLAGQFQQQGLGRCVNVVLRQIGPDARRRLTQDIRALRILRKCLAQVKVGKVCGMRL
jgi:hypothetical protein